MGRLNKKIKAERVNALKKQYDAFLEEDKKRKERNECILEKLDKMRCCTTLMQVRQKATTEDYIQQNHYNSIYTPPNCSNFSAVTQRHIQQKDDPIPLQEIRKHFILIPKFNQFSHNDTNEDIKKKSHMSNDWRSKYDILEQLKKNEKEGSPDIPENNFLIPEKEETLHFMESQEKNLKENDNEVEFKYNVPNSLVFKNNASPSTENYKKDLIGEYNNDKDMETDKVTNNASPSTENYKKDLIGEYNNDKDMETDKVTNTFNIKDKITQNKNTFTEEDTLTKTEINHENSYHSSTFKQELTKNSSDLNLATQNDNSINDIENDTKINSDDYNKISQEAASTQEYMAESNQEYIADSNQDFMAGSNQEYMVESNKYMPESNQEYMPESNQQYIADSNQDYIAGSNQAYTAESNQEYITESNQECIANSNQEYMPETNQEYMAESNQEYMAESNQASTPASSKEYTGEYMGHNNYTMDDTQQEFIPIAKSKVDNSDHLNEYSENRVTIINSEETTVMNNNNSIVPNNIELTEATTGTALEMVNNEPYYNEHEKIDNTYTYNEENVTDNYIEPSTNTDYQQEDYPAYYENNENLQNMTSDSVKNEELLQQYDQNYEQEYNATHAEQTYAEQGYEQEHDEQAYANQQYINPQENLGYDQQNINQYENNDTSALNVSQPEDNEEAYVEKQNDVVEMNRNEKIMGTQQQSYEEKEQ